MITPEKNTSENLEIIILQNEVKLLEKKIELNKENYKTLYEGSVNATNQHSEQLSNQISAGSLTVDFIALVFTVGGIALALYIQDLSKKMIRLSKKVEESKKEIETTTVNQYLKFKRAETVSILERLNEVPEDITNLSILLLSRDLLPEDYYLLKKAYFEARKKKYRSNDEYITLFAQHFPYESFNDAEIRETFIESFDDQIRLMFTRDIKNLFEGFVRYIKETGFESDSNKVVIKKVINSLYSSVHKVQIDDLKLKLARANILFDKFYSIATQENKAEEFSKWLLAN